MRGKDYWRYLMDRIQYEAKVWDMFYKALEPKPTEEPEQIDTALKGVGR